MHSPDGENVGGADASSSLAPLVMQDVTAVDFEVLLDVQKGTGTKGGVGVVAGIFNLGSQGESTKSNTTTNKIRFTVPVALPLQPYNPEK